MIRVLIVDDEWELRRALRVRIEREGHKVIEAGNALEGVRQLAKKPELALIDYVLPGTMSGVDVAGHADKEATTVLMMTGHDPAILAARWGYRFLQKPIDWPALKLDIERVANYEDTQP